MTEYKVSLIKVDVSNRYKELDAKNFYSAIKIMQMALAVGYLKLKWLVMSMVALKLNP